MEVYCYRVVFPNGVAVRVSPNLDSDRTGEILPFGTILESHKSLVLDGVNYVKLSDGRGWIFSSKRDVKVLDLIEVIRKPSLTSQTLSPRSSSSSSSPPSLHPSSSMSSLVSEDLSPTSSSSATVDLEDQQQPANTTRYSEKKDFRHLLVSPNAPRNRLSSLWREFGMKVKRCVSYDDFLQVMSSCLPAELLPPAIPEPGPARSAWMASLANDNEHRLRMKISTLAGMSRQVITLPVNNHLTGGHSLPSSQQQVAMTCDMSGLEGQLWIAVHLRPLEYQHLLALADRQAQRVYSSQQTRNHRQRLEVKQAILAKLQEVTLAVKPLVEGLVAESSLHGCLLADDVRHFLQRWILIHCEVKGQQVQQQGKGVEEEEVCSSEEEEDDNFTTISFLGDKDKDDLTKKNKKQQLQDPQNNNNRQRLWQAVLMGCYGSSSSSSSSPTAADPSIAGKTWYQLGEILGDYTAYAKQIAFRPEVQHAALL